MACLLHCGQVADATALPGIGIIDSDRAYIERWINNVTGKIFCEHEKGRKQKQYEMPAWYYVKSWPYCCLKTEGSSWYFLSSL